MKVTEQIVNLIKVFAANLRVLKMGLNRIEKLESDGCCNKNAKSNNFEPVNQNFNFYF